MRQWPVIAGITVLISCFSSTAWSQKSDRRHDEALAVVQKAGGKVKVDTKRADRPVEVKLNGAKVVDASLIPLKDIANLQSLSLRLSQVSDAGLQQVGTLTSLRSLSLAETEITDAALEHLKG